MMKGEGRRRNNIVGWRIELDIDRHNGLFV